MFSVTWRGECSTVTRYASGICHCRLLSVTPVSFSLQKLNEN